MKFSSILTKELYFSATHHIHYQTLNEQLRPQTLAFRGKAVDQQQQQSCPTTTPGVMVVQCSFGTGFFLAETYLGFMTLSSLEMNMSSYKVSIERYLYDLGAAITNLRNKKLKLYE